MRLKDSIQVSLFLAIGFILHQITPGFGLGMKPDLMLGMLFVIILMKKDFKLALFAGIIAGIITSLTTTFPGGQIPNIIDKFITTLFIFGLITLLKDKVNDKVLAGVIGLVGTLFSGAVFLGSALMIVGLPGPFTALFVAVVLPASVANAIAVTFLYPIVKMSEKLVSKKDADNEVKA